MNKIERLKERQLNILKDVIEVCRKLDVPYFAIGGTAIGAVRHRGYIPWDDDIDIAMLKEDYERFIVEAPKHLPKHLFLQTLDTEVSYLQCFAKVRDSRTTYLEEAVSHLKMNHGIYIDIFPYYYVPCNKIARYWHYFLQRFYYLRITCDINPNSVYIAKAHPIRKYCKLIIRFILLRLLPDAIGNRKRLDRLFKKVQKTDRVILADCTCGVHGFPRKWFEETIELPFENIVINVPKSFDDFLRARFGDYMQLPPEAQRMAHHYADVIDPDRPYTEYTRN